MMMINPHSSLTQKLAERRFFLYKDYQLTQGKAQSLFFIILYETEKKEEDVMSE
jgi:hypothetical protein